MALPRPARKFPALKADHQTDINSDFFALARGSKIVVNVQLIPRGDFP